MADLDVTVFPTASEATYDRGEDTWPINVRLLVKHAEEKWKGPDAEVSIMLSVERGQALYDYLGVALQEAFDDKGAVRKAIEQQAPHLLEPRTR